MHRALSIQAFSSLDGAGIACYDARVPGPTDRLQLDMRGLPTSVVPRLKEIAFRKDITLTDLCRTVLIKFALETDLAAASPSSDHYVDVDSAEAEPPPWGTQ